MWKGLLFLLLSIGFVGMSVAFFVEAAQGPSAQVDGLAARGFGSCCVGIVLLVLAGMMLGSGGTPQYEARERQHLGRRVERSYDENRPVDNIDDLNAQQAAQRASAKGGDSASSLTVEHPAHRQGGSSLQSIHDAMSSHYGGTGQGYSVNLTDAGGQDAGTFLVAPNTLKLDPDKKKPNKDAAEEEQPFWEESSGEDDKTSEDDAFRVDL